MSFVYCFDPKYLLSYVLFFLIVLFGIKKPEVAKVLNPFLKIIFWNHPNQYLRENLKVKTIDEVNLSKAIENIQNVNSLIEEKQESSLNERNFHRFGFKNVYTNDKLGDDQKISTQAFKVVELGFIDKIKNVRFKISRIIFMMNWFFDLCAKF